MAYRCHKGRKLVDWWNCERHFPPLTEDPIQHLDMLTCTYTSCQHAERNSHETPALGSTCIPMSVWSTVYVYGVLLMSHHCNSINVGLAIMSWQHVPCFRKIWVHLNTSFFNWLHINVAKGVNKSIIFVLKILINRKMWCVLVPLNIRCSKFELFLICQLKFTLEIF